MIYLIIKDGLGNQLFQYAYARYLQELYRNEAQLESLVINPYFIQNTIYKDNDLREMSLQHFQLNSQVEFLTGKEQKIAMNRFKWKLLVSTPIKELYHWRIKRQKVDTEKLFSHRAVRGIYYTYTAYTNYPSFLARSKNKYIFGFFQSEKNFYQISAIIREELRVKSIPTSPNVDMIKKIQSCNSVCLHIRRGDYLNPRWKNLQICTFEYYNNSVNEVLNQVENPVFFVFSNTHDDIEWIRKNYNFKDNKGHRPINLVFVDLDNPDHEELRLMYNCKHFIISNSTFSWWGAYLSTYPHKIVLAPDRWNYSTDEDSLMYLEDWIKVKTE